METQRENYSNHTLYLVGEHQKTMTENGTTFVIKMIERITRHLGNTHTTYPQANLVGSTNKTISGIIKVFLDGNHKNWDELLEDIQVTISTSIPGLTKHTRNQHIGNCVTPNKVLWNQQDNFKSQESGRYATTHETIYSTHMS